MAQSFNPRPSSPGLVYATESRFAGGLILDGRDGSAAIQAAINSKKGRGGTVVIPEPPSGVKIQIGSTINVPARVRLIGASSLGSRLIAAPGLNKQMFTLGAVDGSDPNWHWGEVSNLHIDGNKANQALTPSVTPTAVTRNPGGGINTTFTTATPHGLAIGDYLVMSGFTSDAYNGRWAVFSTPSATTFTVNLLFGPAADPTVIGTYRRWVGGIALPQAGETSCIRNVVASNCFDDGIIQGPVGTPMRYESISMHNNNNDGLALWTDRPVVVDSPSGDTNGASLVGVHGKAQAGGGAVVGSVTIIGIKAENATTPGLLIDDYAAGVTLVGGGITMDASNNVAQRSCIERTNKGANSGLNVVGVTLTPFFSNGSRNHFYDLTSTAASVGSGVSGALFTTFFIPQVSAPIGFSRIAQRRAALTDAANVTVNSANGSFFRLFTTTAVGATRTIATPVSAPLGAPNVQEISISVQNGNATAITTSWGAGYKMAPWVDPAVGKTIMITFLYDGTNWVEKCRSAEFTAA